MDTLLKMPKGVENHIDIGKIANLVSTDSYALAYSFIRYSDIYVSRVSIGVSNSRLTYLFWYFTVRF